MESEEERWRVKRREVESEGETWGVKGRGEE